MSVTPTFRMAARVAALCALAAAPLGAQDGPERQEVVALEFPGATALSTDRLKGAIATRETSCKTPVFLLACWIGDWDWAERNAYLDRDAVVRDAERIELLYEAWGFPDAVVEPEIEPRGEDKVAVRFHVSEGEPIVVDSLAIVGLEGFTPPVELELDPRPPAKIGELPPPTPLREGEPYALPRLEALQQEIRRALAERGRPFAEIEVGGDVDAADRTARVVLEVEPGRRAYFGDVEITAEPPIEREVVRRRLAFEPGATYRPSRLERTERALYRLPVVERALVEPVEPVPGDSLVPVRVLVEARRLQGVQVEGTISSTDCLEMAAFWRHLYFAGDPQVLSVGGGLSNLLSSVAGGGFPCSSVGEGEEFHDLDYFVEAELRRPQFFSIRNSLLLQAHARRESVPNVFVQSGYGFEATLARELRDDLIATVSYSPARNELDAAGLYFCGNFGVCSREGIAELTEPAWLSPVELVAVWSPGAQVPVAPGFAGPDWLYRARAGVAAAGLPTASDYDYVRALVDASVSRRLSPRVEVAGRARGGLSGGGDVLPPQIRFFSGGPNTLRGRPQNLFGPSVAVVAPDEVAGIGCVPVEGGCPGVPVVDPDRVQIRPVGGEAVLDGGVEARYALTSRFQAAAFIDAAWLSRSVDRDAAIADGADLLVTPGIGIRLLTDLGPIRIDIGFDPSGPETLPLLTQREDGALVRLGRVVYAPFEHDDPGLLTEFRRRLQIHLAIGQPF